MATNRRKSGSNTVHPVTELFNSSKETGVEITESNESNEVAVEKQEVNKEAPVQKASAPAKKKFEASDGIPCKSITSGKLFMNGIKSHVRYEWYDKDSVTEVEYQDLVAAVRSNSSYIFKPYFIVEDEDFLAEFPAVKKVFDSLYSLEDLEDVFNLPANDMIATIKKLPSGAQDSIKHIASRLVTDGRLDSVKKINSLDNYFGTKLALLTGLYTE